jgi:hypothetical protein
MTLSIDEYLAADTKRKFTLEFELFDKERPSLASRV